MARHGGSQGTPAVPAAEQGTVDDPRLQRVPGTIAPPGQGLPGRCRHPRDYRLVRVAADKRAGQSVRGRTGRPQAPRHVLGSGSPGPSRSGGRQHKRRCLRGPGRVRPHLVPGLGVPDSRLGTPLSPLALGASVAHDPSPWVGGAPAQTPRGSMGTAVTWPGSPTSRPVSMGGPRRSGRVCCVCGRTTAEGVRRQPLPQMPITTASMMFAAGW